MHPAIAYLLKMLCCSAILLGYYWMALRNERFHQWNRFYLLLGMLLSVVIPIVNIPLLMQEEPTVVVTMVASLPWNKVAASAPGFVWNWKSILLLIGTLVSVVMLLHLLASVVRMIRLYHAHSPTYFKEVSVVITEEQTAPFSFFKWLFWRSDIDPDSDHGQRILQHELTHINEKHSADKLFTELLLIVFWMNPFFWLMRKELYAIHEFLADKKAIGCNDGAAFAAMILQAAHPGQTPALSNPFFTSHLKRRLIMITTSPAPKYSYLRRISGLMLMICTGILLVLSIENATAQKAPPPPPSPVAPPDGQWTTLPDSIKSAEVIDKKGVCYIKYEMKDGRKFTYELNQAKKKGYFIPPPPPPPAPAPPPAPVSPASGVAPVSAATQAEAIVVQGYATISDATPLFIYAGLEISEAQMKMIDPNMIESIDVLKGESAIKAYGEKGKNGVVKITPKNSNYKLDESVKQAPSSNGELTVIGYKTTPDKKQPEVRQGEVVVTGYKTSDKQPLYVLNGTVISESEMKEVSPDNISSINVLKGPDAMTKYGDNGKNGVVEIQLKEGSPEKVFTAAEVMPSFPGGEDAWRKYLERNLQYPELARASNTTGSVTVQFIVKEDGSLSDIKTLNNPGAGLGEEAMRLIKLGPKWNAAVQNGKKVAAIVKQPIVFRLN